MSSQPNSGTNAIKEFRVAIDLCLKAQLTTPTLVLTFCSIDTMAWLGLPDNRADVTRADFIEWVNRYLLPDSGIACTAEDLYSARCGIVHTMTAESRMIREGDARRIVYAWGNKEARDLQDFLDQLGEPSVALHAETLINAFDVALDRFVNASEQDPELNRRINSRLDKIFTNM